MRKFEIVERKAEIEWKDRMQITTGCTADDPDPVTIEKFDNLEEAQKKLCNFRTKISERTGNTGKYYAVTEYCVIENEYDEDGEWISGGDVWDCSEMRIDVLVKATCKTVAACANFEEAEKIIENYNGDNELYISF